MTTATNTPPKTAFRRYTCWLVGVLATAALLTGFGGEKTYPDHIQNKNWDQNKPPVLEEPPLSAKLDNQAWNKLLEVPQCEADARVYRTLPSTQVLVTAYKEHTVGVAGKFKRHQFLLEESTDSDIAEGRGLIDLTSWDSDLTPRDRRVMRYVFGVEELKPPVAMVEFEIHPWKTTPGKWRATALLRTQLRGRPIEAELPVQVDRTEKLLSVSSTAPTKIAFFSEAMEASFRKMMEICNHHFMATYAEARLEAKFASACQNKNK